MGDRDWRDILTTYLTVDKKFDSISDKIEILISETEDHERHLIAIEEHFKTLPSEIEATCHRVFDAKVATWRTHQSRGSQKRLPRE